MGYWPSLEEPKTFNEKLQWFKLYVRDPVIPKCADKYLVRDYVAQKIGEQYLVPLWGVFDSVNEIDLDKLPNQFVLKPNHASGEVIVCHDKNQIDWDAEKRKMTQWLKQNYYYQTGEWGYKDIPPKILCEKLLHGEIVDYKFFCFQGVPALVWAMGNREADHVDVGNYDLDFHLLEISGNKCYVETLKKPKHWEEMIQIAKILSADFPFVRVDLYDLEGKVYFGELTFTPANGMGHYFSEKWDIKLGHLYDIQPFYEEMKQSGKVFHWKVRK